MLKILAIDYGTRRIGLAVSIGNLAEPLKIIQNREAKIEDVLQICDKENIEMILVGISENQMAEQTLKFVQALQSVTQIPVVTYDETLSSQTVHRKLAHSGMKRSRRQQPIDHLAAAEFLQEYLDTRQTT